MKICGIRALAIGILLGSASVTGSAQARPDFSGEWVRADSAEQRSVATVGDAGFRVGTMGSGWGSPLTLRQQANLLVVEYAYFGSYDLQPKLSLTFTLDGSEARNSVTIGHSESLLRSRGTWHADTLVILTQYPAPAGVKDTAVRQALSLTSTTSLVIETTHGNGPPTRSAYTKR
jgi:hypothetical protein